MLIDENLTRAYFKDQKTFLLHQHCAKNFVINEPLLSRGLTCESFKLILPLIPRYGMALVFPSESVSVIVDLSGNGLFVHPQFNFRGGFERNSL